LQLRLQASEPLDLGELDVGEEVVREFHINVPEDVSHDNLVDDLAHVLLVVNDAGERLDLSLH